MPRIVVTLLQEEQQALVELAQIELRTPREQARAIVRQALREYGLLPEDGDQKAQQGQEVQYG